MSEKY